MDTYLLIVLLLFFGVISLFICLMDWRKGLLICIMVGFLADPVRKLLPGEPVFMVIVVGIFFLVVVLGFLSRYHGFYINNIGLWRNALKIPLGLFIMWLVYQAFVSLIRYQNPVLTTIGLISYLAPFPGFLIAYYYGLKPENINKFIKLYIIFAILMLSGIYLSYFGINWGILEEVGSGVILYDKRIGILTAYPGFFRSTEGAAWHAGATVCLLIILSISGQLKTSRMFIAVLIIALIVAGLLTGRRKMLVEIFIFASFFGVLLLYFKRRIGRILSIFILIAGVVSIILIYEGLDPIKIEQSRINPYIQRGSSVVLEVDERFTNVGLYSIPWAIRLHGYFGGGLGIASQGGQHFGGGAKRFGGAGEGGLGKIVAELGLPGLLLVTWILIAVLFYVGYSMVKISRFKTPLVQLFYGLVAFFTANIFMYMVATQIFGDPFVLLILGCLLGFAFAISDIIQRGASREVYVR